MASVREWAARNAYDYQFADDGIFDLCGAGYLARVGGNVRSITNLARLELTRQVLRDGYDRAIWLDADLFVFAPEQLAIDVTSGYAFCKEAWIYVDGAGHLRCVRGVNNAAFVFTRDQPDLDFLIASIRHVAAARDLTSNYQVGVWLLTGLERSLNFDLLRTIGMFSHDVLTAIVQDNAVILRQQAIEFGDPVYAANLGWSVTPGDDAIAPVMDRLESTRGDVLNRYLPAGGGGELARPWCRNDGAILQTGSEPADSPSRLLRRLVRVTLDRLAGRR